MSNPKVRVALLLGGDCSEREISWKTGMSMHGALSPERYDVTVYDVTSRHTTPPDDTNDELHVETSRLSAEEIAALTSWWSGLNAAGKSSRISWQELIAVLNANSIDVVLPALHGGWGEDGTLQSLLEVAGIRYTGSPTRSSVLAMDKRLCKAIARDLGIPTAQGWLIDSEAAGQLVPRNQKSVIKPNSGGSSVGITILPETAGEEQWQRAITEALADGGSAIAEEFIEGGELTAAVIGSGDDARTLPLVEIVPQSEFFDFQSKYAAGGAQHVIPPHFSEDIQNLIADYALRIHRALGCRGVARSDWIITKAGIPYFLEINTLPGMTRTSLVPDAARAADISFEKLLGILIEEALK